MKQAIILYLQERIARYYERKLLLPHSIHKAEDISGWATAMFGTSRVEHLWALALDGKNRLYAWTQLSQGTIDRTAFHRRELARWALLEGAAGVILVHNHPSGSVRPSDADLKAMRQSTETLSVLEIRFLDFIIVTPQGHYYSAKHGGLM